MTDKSSEQLLFITILFTLSIIAMNRAVSQLFVLNFSTSGMNITITFAVLLLYGLFYAFSSLFIKIELSKHYNIFLILSFISISISIINNSVLALTSASAFLIFTYPIVIEFVSKMRSDILYGLGAGIAVLITLGAIFDTISLYGTTTGKIVLLLISVLWLITGYLIKDTDIINSSTELISISSIYFYLYSYLLFFAYPALISSWHYPQSMIFDMQISTIYQLKYLIVTIEIFIGIFLGVMLYSRFRGNDIFFALITIIAIIESVVLGKLLFVSILIVITGHLILLGGLLDNADIDNRHHFSTGLGQLLALVFLFLYALAGNWAFIPTFLQSITKGLASFYIVLLSSLLPVQTVIRRFIQ